VTDILGYFLTGAVVAFVLGGTAYVLVGGRR
jgi:hypothetical protein